MFFISMNVVAVIVDAIFVKFDIFVFVVVEVVVIVVDFVVFVVVDVVVIVVDFDVFVVVVVDVVDVVVIVVVFDVFVVVVFIVDVVDVVVIVVVFDAFVVVVVVVLVFVDVIVIVVVVIVIVDVVVIVVFIVVISGGKVNILVVDKEDLVDEEDLGLVDDIVASVVGGNADEFEDEEDESFDILAVEVGVNVYSFVDSDGVVLVDVVVSALVVEESTSGVEVSGESSVTP